MTTELTKLHVSEHVYPMPAITEAKRRELVAVLNNRLNMYRAVLENQRVSSVRPRGGLELKVDESILMAEILLATLTAATPIQIKAVLPDAAPPEHLYHTGDGRDTRRRNASMERGWKACHQQAMQRIAFYE